MHGTWKVTGVGGAGLALPIILVIASAAGIEWVLANMWIIVVILLVCGAVTACIVGKLIRWQSHRAEQIGALWASQRQAGLSTPERPEVTGSARPAITGDTHLHIHFGEGIPADEQAELVRRAISGQ